MIETQVLEVGGIKWNFLKNQVTRPSCVLFILHGWNTAGTKSWLNFISTFDVANLNNTVIIAPDMPGFGLTSEPELVFDVENYATAVYSFIESVKNKYSELNGLPVFLLGHSFGGAVSSILAGDHFEEFKKIILVAPAIVREPLTLKQKTINLISKIGKRILFLSDLQDSWIKKLWHKMIGSNDYTKTSVKMRQIIRRVVRQDLQNKLKYVKQPVLLVWGDKDKYTPIYQAKLIAKQLQNVDVKILPNINHGVHIYDYKTLVSLTQEFLNL